MSLYLLIAIFATSSGISTTSIFLFFKSCSKLGTSVKDCKSLSSIFNCSLAYVSYVDPFWTPTFFPFKSATDFISAESLLTTKIPLPV